MEIGDISRPKPVLLLVKLPKKIIPVAAFAGRAMAAGYSRAGGLISLSWPSNCRSGFVAASRAPGQEMPIDAVWSTCRTAIVITSHEKDASSRNPFTSWVKE